MKTAGDDGENNLQCNRIIIEFSLFRYISADCVAKRTVSKKVHVQV